MVGEYVVKSEGGRKQLVINYKGAPYGADVAQYAACMQDVVSKLREVDADEIVLSEYYERIYDDEQTRFLRQVADLVNKFENEAVWAPSNLGKTTESRLLAKRHDAVMQFLGLLPGDFFKAYLFLLQLLKEEGQKLEPLPQEQKEDLAVYLKTLDFLRSELEKTSIIQQMKQYLVQLSEIPQDRAIYHAFFEAAIKPSFIGSRIFFAGVENLQLVDQYDVAGTTVFIYRHPEKVEYMYYINPPEYTLAPEKYFLLEKTKEVVATHRPTSVSFLDMQQARRYFGKIYNATLGDLGQRNRISLTSEERDQLATIVARYTIGFGILEILLSDRQLTDVYIDSPLGEKPMYVVHSKYGQCQTNVIFSEEEAKSTISRFRSLSGRPFDEAHPILDFDLADLQTRIAAIGRPLAVDGTAFAFRLHKETPWTLAQFLEQKMFSPMAAGLLSFFVDAQASMLIVGSRGAGKTSLLQALMQEISQNLRIIVQEDSVTGDSELMVERGGRLQRTTVGKLVDGLLEEYGTENIGGKDVLRTNPEGVRVFALDAENKISLQPVTQFIRHRVSKPLYEVVTRTGRHLKVTGDHSLFTLGNFGVEPIKTSKLKPGDFLAVPRRLPSDDSTGLPEIDVLERCQLPGSAFLQCEEYRAWGRAHRKALMDKARENGNSKGTVQNWLRKGILPMWVARDFPELLCMKEVKFKLDGKSKAIPAKLRISPAFLNLIGLWLADGCYDGKYGVVIAAGEPEEVKAVDAAVAPFGLVSRQHSDGYSRIVSNTGLVWALRNGLGLEGDSFSKRVPDWAFGLSDAGVSELLKGYFSGDGYAGKKEVTACSVSGELLAGVRTLLLRLGIVARGHGPSSTGMRSIAISANQFLEKFQAVGFLQERKNAALRRLVSRQSTHDSTDVIPLPRQLLETLAASTKGFNRQDYLVRQNRIGRRKLLQMASALSQTALQGYFSQLAKSDIYWDQVYSVEPVPVEETYVYDFSVPGCENFVCENIIAHNTQELPVPQLKRLGFNIQRLKTRPPLGMQSESEVSAEDALRTALRLGDSVLIVGEVRSLEAKALYEAMRVGAVGNVVMGTIHGESAYSIWDRVVNDLGVPTTSFKATDFAVVAAPIRFQGSLKRSRRLVEVTEIGKYWNEDPQREGGFLQWMQFDARKDELEMFEERIKESDWMKRLQRNRGLSVEQIWSEIKARAESKQYLVEMRRKYDLPKLLEAENTIKAHAKYLLLAESQREESGAVEHARLLREWKEWVNNSLAKPLLKK